LAALDPNVAGTSRTGRTRTTTAAARRTPTPTPDHIDHWTTKANPSDALPDAFQGWTVTRLRTARWLLHQLPGWRP